MMTDDEFRKDLCVHLQISCSMLVDNGDTVIIDYIVGQRTTLYRIHATRLGPILGTKGVLLNAIRAIAIAAGHKRKIRIAIDLVEYYETQATRHGAPPLRTNNLRGESSRKVKFLRMDKFTKIWDVEPEFRDQGRYPKMASMNDAEFRNHLFAYLQISCGLLADDGDTVLIDCTAEQKSIFYRIRTSNIGQIIGKRGRLINAIREITYASARHNRMRIVIGVIKYEEASRKVA